MTRARVASVVLKKKRIKRIYVYFHKKINSMLATKYY